MENKKLVIIGGGPAGLAAALSAVKTGLHPEEVLILERDDKLGGILNQCIHNGFGLHTFHEELTGPEYAQRYIDQVLEAGIPCELNSMVTGLSEDRTVTYINRSGVHQIQPEAVVLAMGCRERPRGALSIPGTRPAGIYSAGTAQKLVNLDGWMPGHKVVILGSGDIGLIMARRMKLEGADVKAVAELMPYSSGLKRNIVQCLDDYDIPLLLSHTVTEIKGKDRVESIVLSKVDENRQPIAGTEQEIECDTLLLSCGLLPENELSRQAGIAISPVTNGPVVNESLQTSVEGIFSCGNVLHVHDLVDFVSSEAASAGGNAAEYILENRKSDQSGVPITTGGIVRYTVPFMINPASMQNLQTVRFRVGTSLKDGCIRVLIDGKEKIHLNKRILAPGEMESVVLKKEWLENAGEIRIEAGAQL